MRSAGDQHATLPFEERGRKGCGTSRRTALPPSRDALNRRAASYDLPIQLFVLPDRSHSKAEPHSHRTDRAASGSRRQGHPQDLYTVLQLRQGRRRGAMTFAVKIKKWHAVASWTWNAGQRPPCSLFLGCLPGPGCLAHHHQI